MKKKDEKIDFLEALKALNAEKKIPMDYMLEKLGRAIAASCRNNYNNENVRVGIDDDGKFFIKLSKNVVENPLEDGLEISLIEAQKIDPLAEIGGAVEIDLDAKHFGRIAAQTTRNIIRQGIRENERDQIVESLKCNEGEIVSAKVIRMNFSSMIIKIGETETIFPAREISLVEDVSEGDFIKVYVSRVESSERGPQISVSRGVPEFTKKLFEMNIPEIAEKIVEIKSIVREAGSRTKIAVASKNPDVDPVGACIGEKGMRIKEIINELGQERVDVVYYYDEPEKFIEAALSPARIISIEILHAESSGGIKNACCVTVPDSQLSLAIGMRGQNVRLASKLTGWKIDLRPESGYLEEKNWD
jgi:N utilization substance protein A